MKQRVWLSFDLGINGDYHGMYELLDKQEASECGSSFASFIYTYENILIEELKQEIIENINIDNRDRVYIIYKNEKERTVGRFIIGKRKKPPWLGYAQGISDEIDSEYFML